MTKIKIETSTHDDFLTQLSALRQISDPEQKFEVLTKSIPYFETKNRKLGGTPQQIQERNQALEKTSQEWIKLQGALSSHPAPRFDPEAIRSLSMVGSAMVMNTFILVKEANW